MMTSNLCFKLIVSICEKKSNVEVDGGWALLIPLFLANKDVWYLDIVQ
jgi:hypothetical protein